MGAIVPWSSGSMEKKLDPFDKYRKKWAHAAFDKPEVAKSTTDTTDTTTSDSAVSTSNEKWNRRNRVRKSSILTSSGSNGTLLGG